MNKTELVAAMAKEADLPKKDVEDAFHGIQRSGF